MIENLYSFVLQYPWKNSRVLQIIMLDWLQMWVLYSNLALKRCISSVCDTFLNDQLLISFC